MENFSFNDAASVSSGASSPLLFSSSSRNHFDDADLVSHEDALYRQQLREREERERAQQLLLQQQQASRGPTLLGRYAKRAIVKRIEHARQEQVAARASELLVQEQARRRQAAAAASGSMRMASTGSMRMAMGGREQSFFCRSTSYGEYGLQQQQQQLANESSAFTRHASVGDLGAMSMIGGNAFDPQQQLGGGGGATTAAAAQSSAMVSIDVTFGALVDELREAMPKSGLPTPDIALVMDRFLGGDVPVHFIGHLQRLRQTLRDITRLSRGIRRHMDLHADTVAELAEVLDEDAEDEENARREVEAQERAERRAKRRRERNGQRRGPSRGGKRRATTAGTEHHHPHQQQQPQRNASEGRRRGLQSGSTTPSAPNANASSQQPQQHGHEDETETFHLVPPACRQRNESDTLLQQAPPDEHDVSSGLDDDDDDGAASLSSGSSSGGDENEGGGGGEAKPAWVGNVPRLRTARPRTALLERMSQLVQRADLHAARVIDDVHKWRRYSHTPLPFFHGGDNVFFALHRRYGAGLAVNRACDLLRRYAAGEVFFYVSPFDFSVSTDDSEADGAIGGGGGGGGNSGAGGSMRVAASQINDETVAGMSDDDATGGAGSDSSSPTSPLGAALGELKRVASFGGSASSFSKGNANGGSSGAFSGGAAAAAAAAAAAGGHAGGTTAVGKGGGSGSQAMRDKWKRIEKEAEMQNRYLKRTLTQLSGGWYRPALRVVTDLLWERHMYWKQQTEGKTERGHTGGSYMRFSSKGGRSNDGGGSDAGAGLDQHRPTINAGGSGSGRRASRLHDAINDSRSTATASTMSSQRNPFNPGVRAARLAAARSGGNGNGGGASDPPRTSVSSMADEQELRLGLDWRFLSAGCYLPVVSRALRQHLIMCCLNGLAHVARHNPGVGATAGTAVQRLIALNASHLARRYLHLWQAALRRRKKLRLQAAQLALRNMERLRKLRFGTFIKFYAFRNESGRLWRPMLHKVRASLIRRYMHHLFMNRALNITTRAMRRAIYLRYFRVLHFLVVRRRVGAARVTFSQEGDRRKIRASTAASTKDALRELAAAAALVNPTQGIKLQMERHYASDGDALRVIAETGGGINCVPSLVWVIRAGRAMLPFRRFHDQHDAERARLAGEEFVTRRELIFEFCLLNLMAFAQSNRVALE